MKKRIFLLSLFILIILFNNCCYAISSTGKTFYYKNEDEGILAYKQVNAFQLKLSDGRVLSNMSVSSESSVDIEENMKDVEIVFVLDNSGSMSGNRIQTLKSATQELVDKLFDKIGTEHLRFGFVKFTTRKVGELSLTNKKKSISNFINGMEAGGGTHMADSLSTALTMLTSSVNSDAIKMIITLSDGQLADEQKTIEIFSKIPDLSISISTISIFVGTNITDAFSSLASQNPSLHKNMETTDSNMADTLVNGIYNEIYMKVVIISEPKTSFDLNNAGIIPGDDKIILQLDAELLHGATLYIEYIINIVCAFDSKNIKITDIPDKSLIYNSGQKLLTENATNSKYGWSYKNGNLYCKSGNSTIPATKEYTKKLVLSTVLTPEVLNQSSAFNNCIEFSVDKILENNTTKTINASTAQDGGKIRSLSFLLIPPTGLNITHIIIINIAVVVFFTCIFILLYVSNKIRHNKKTRS